MTRPHDLRSYCKFCTYLVVTPTQQNQNLQYDNKLRKFLSQNFKLISFLRSFDHSKFPIMCLMYKFLIPTNQTLCQVKFEIIRIQLIDLRIFSVYGHGPRSNCLGKLRSRARFHTRLGSFQSEMLHIDDLTYSLK